MDLERHFRRLKRRCNLFFNSRLMDIERHFPSPKGCFGSFFNSLLRMHSPHHFGDRLHDYRESVRLANLKKETVRGFEEGRVINGYRFVHPLFHQAGGEPRHVGSVEVSISMGSLLGTLVGYAPGRYRFVIARAQIEKKLFPDARQHYLAWEGIPDFLIDRALHDGPLLPDAACEKIHLPQLLAPLLAEGRDFACRHHCNGRAYMINALALTNLKSELTGYLIGLEEDRVDPAERRRYRLFQGGLTLLLLLLSGFLTRIIHDRHRIRHLALHDHLTGAFNRSVIEGLFCREVEKARRYKRSLSLILFDIDHFKKINDTFGHATGDRVLKQLVRITEARIRTADYLVRWGGEEFLLLLPETGSVGAMVAAEKLRAALETADMGIPTPVTASFGVACFQGGKETLEELVHAADQRLYRAKQAGRNRVCGPDPP
jgi:diguanylate cyclase (GGDEF)-like protein